MKRVGSFAARDVMYPRGWTVPPTFGGYLQAGILRLLGYRMVARQHGTGRILYARSPGVPL